MIRDVKISAVLNGWVVRVGCQTLVFEDLEVMLKEVGAYLTDPDGIQEAYRENAVNAKYVFGDEAAEETARIPSPTVRIVGSTWGSSLTEEA